MEQPQKYNRIRNLKKKQRKYEINSIEWQNIENQLHNEIKKQVLIKRKILRNKRKIERRNQFLTLNNYDFLNKEFSKNNNLNREKQNNIKLQNFNKKRLQKIFNHFKNNAKNSELNFVKINKKILELEIINIIKNN